MNPPGLGLDSLDVVMERHPGAKISHPRHRRAYSDLAAEYSGSALRDVGGGVQGVHRGHENNKIAVCLYCTYCTTKPKVTVSVIVVVYFFSKHVLIRLEL
jgi:hypothetical protein